jgi:hypothetical protein
MESRDITIHVKKVKNIMGFRIMEDKEDIASTVKKLNFSLKDGLVNSIEMTFDDGSVWTGTFIPLA